jgi:hypothetical protein
MTPRERSSYSISEVQTPRPSKWRKKYKVLVVCSTELNFTSRTISARVRFDKMVIVRFSNVGT